MYHGVYISCVFVSVERLSFTRAWCVGRLLCGSRLLLLSRKMYMISDIIWDMIS
jgi:hypothetical protein